jgi:hypothetical protein
MLALGRAGFLLSCLRSLFEKKDFILFSTITLLTANRQTIILNIHIYSILLSLSAPSGGLRQSPPGSRPGSDTSRELPSLPVQTAPDSCEQYYDEPDALIRPVLHNYEHMVNQDSLYNEIDESVSVGILRISKCSLNFLGMGKYV